MSALKSILPRLPEIKAMAEKATPGPWTTIPPDSSCRDWFVSRTRFPRAEGKFYIARFGESDEGDARLCAAARTDVPALVEALEEARELLTHCERLFREHDDTPKMSGEFAECGREHPGIRERLREALGQ